MIRRITIIRTGTAGNTFNDQLRGFATSLGMLGERDKDKSCFRIFIELLKTREKELSSDDLAEKTGLTRGTVVHHINMLMDRGFVINVHKRYRLREENLENLIVDLRREMETALNELNTQAKQIDKFLHLLE